MKKQSKLEEKENCERLLWNAAEKSFASSPGTSEMKERIPEELLQELQVHQIELEMQNEKLRKAQLALEESRQRYADLYDFAPVGYFTFTPEVLIKDANLTAATLLGVARQKLINRRFRSFVASSDLDLWDQHFLSVLREEEKQTCDLMLKRQDGSTFYAGLVSIRIELSREATEVHTTVTDITAGKRAEEEMRESEEMFKSYLEHAPDGVYLSDLEGNFLYGNRKCEEIIGYRREELIGKNFLELNILSEKSLNKAVQLLQANTDGRATGPDEIDLINKEGRLKPVEINTNVVQRMGQNIVLSFVRDITERKQAEESLRESEERYKALFDRSLDFIYVTDFEGRFIDANATALNRLGYTREEIRSLNFASLLSEDQVQLALKTLQEIRETGIQMGLMEFRLRHKNGSDVYVETRGSTIMSDGKPVAIQAIARDITERRRVEDALHRSETKFHTLYDSSSDAVMLLDEKGFFDCNKATLAIFGCVTQEEFYSKHPADLSPLQQPCGTDSMVLANQMIATAMEKGGLHFEWMHKRNDTGKTFPADVLLTAMELDGKMVVQAVVRDITERKEAEAALQERYKELNCLYSISALLELPDISLNEILEKTVMLIPPAWKFPEITEACIMLEGQTFLTARFRETPWMLGREIIANGKPAGKVEVGYLEERKASDEGPFSKEERYLINAIAGRLGRVIDRMRGEEALLESEGRYRAVAESASDAIITADSTGIIVSWNGGAEKIFGYTEAEICGQSLNRLIPERYRERHLAGLKRLQIGGEPQVIGRTVELDGLRKDMSEFPIELSLAQWETSEGRFYTAILRDITERKRLQENVEYFAIHDTLTGLLNRRSLEEMLNRTIARAKRGAISSLLYMDLDNFKDVNDKVGHTAGDEVLKILSDLLKAELRTEDIVFRLGGDEFAVLLEGMDNGKALPAAERLRLVVEKHRFELSGRLFPLSLSIGLIEIEGTLTTGELLSQADAAMYQAKAQGKNRVVVYR